MLGLFDGLILKWVLFDEIDLLVYVDKLVVVCVIVMEIKDFVVVDVFKFVLMDVGVEVCMFKVGVELLFGVGFDVIKLEGL